MAFDFSTFHQQAQKVLDHTMQDLGSLRTGKASVQLLDSVQVEAYGAMMKLNEVANISIPDPHLIVITPWDKSMLQPIEKGINIAGLNLNPVIDGTLVRIAIPPLTEERRKEMVKLLNQKIEGSRVMLRTVRTDTKKDIEKQKDSGGVSEDAIKTEADQLEKKVKEYMDKLDQLAKAKEADLMKV
jgi:ribosome recycling factor